ncbi:hypothetical protein [Burkholderia lata]|uniref:hypothetical protein n=1 Tax=Burkholderia lata (strain ATCC 17760 / DSM 23089 / LMG 22485 / NCIMB 9086 / R18194 / 383) TaxID=482957 RepID=UPI00242A4412|nr:hypothetical protein [Burkholderia lata]
MRETGYITRLEIIARSERVISEISAGLISHSEITEWGVLLRCGRRRIVAVESKRKSKAVEFAEFQANLDLMKKMN